MSDKEELREKLKNGEVIVETNKDPAFHNPFLETLYEKGVVDQQYFTPEQDYMMVESTNSYKERKKHKELYHAIKYMAAKVKSDAERPEPIFRRVSHLTLGDRFKALREEVRKINYFTLRPQMPDMSHEHVSALISISDGDSKLRLEAMSIIDAWENHPISFTEHMRIKTSMINRTRVGKLKIHEKFYAYTIIALQYWRKND
jgi:hypothetical protein